MTDTDSVLEEFGLPELPEAYDGPDARQLWLFRERLEDQKVPLGEPVSLADAQEYCQREDTHGSDWKGNLWSVGFQRA